MQKIKLTDGCPNNCSYCYEPKEMTFYGMPDIYDREVQILDMNFLANPNAKEYIQYLGLIDCKTELVCGIDYRLLDQETANLLHDNNFIKIRWAWDYNFGLQRKMRWVKNTLVRAGYKPRELAVFILVNWKIPYVDCCKKLDLLKVWNVKVNDCCFDGGYDQALPLYWKPEQIKRFRAACRKHNQYLNHEIDPEYN